MDFCPCVEINYPLFVTFAGHDAFSILKIDITTVEFHQFSNSHSGRGKYINQCKVSWILTGITHQFQSFITICFLDDLARLDFVNPPDRALDDVEFFFEPREKAGEYTTYIIYSYLTPLTFW